MEIKPLTAAHRLEFGGRTFWFCSANCKARFEAAPARYTASAGETLSPKKGGMHPAILRMITERWGDRSTAGSAREKMGTANTPDILKGCVNAAFRRRLP
ncbi:YHS domain-containing protein [Sphingobium sp. CCH11-B1]|jgi:Cu+-exporting ATPase|uniref:YHS domain-containing protein n=1 Tax=Sphingobium sp. CCH11-B1 TaxID=1768781 RepID=UPI0009E93DF9|nr:YHS domain-containing protein [Sphingobium sp. CCH11-B1]